MKLQQLDVMTLNTIKFAVEEFEKSEGKLPTKLSMNTLMCIALRADPVIIEEFKKLTERHTSAVSVGTLNQILAVNELPEVTIDTSIGNGIVAMT